MSLTSLHLTATERGDSEHEFQQDKADEICVQIRKRNKFNIDIDDHLQLLLSKYQNDDINGPELAIKSERAVKSS